MLRIMSKRWLMLAAELKALDATREQLTIQFSSHLRKQFGAGSQIKARCALG